MLLGAWHSERCGRTCRVRSTSGVMVRMTTSLCTRTRNPSDPARCRLFLRQCTRHVLNQTSFGINFRGGPVLQCSVSLALNIVACYILHANIGKKSSVYPNKYLQNIFCT